MSRAKPPQGPCPITEFLSVLTGPWTLHILWVLGNDGPARFGELRRKVEGISARMLSDRLRLLEERGFIYRHYEPTIPPAVTYGMTDRMRDITKVLDELDKLARKWAKEDSEPRSKHHAVGSHEKPVPPNARAHHVMPPTG
jgi:DNA-binding HxlR family transcriptional regulator